MSDIEKQNGSFENKIVAAKVTNAKETIERLQEEKTELEDKLEEMKIDKISLQRDLGNRNLFKLQIYYLLCINQE